MPAPRRTLHTEESAEVEVLLANMEKLKNLTKKISSSLSTLDTSGDGVKSSIRPIYGNTGRLQSANTNITAIRAAIGKIRADMTERKAEEPIIQAGVRQSGVDVYAAALERTSGTMRGLQESGLKSNQQAAAELQALLNWGNKEMNELYNERLHANSKPLEPLSYIVKGKPFPLIPPEDIQILRKIHMHMARMEGDPKTTRLYANIRGAYVSKTLETLASGPIMMVKKTDPNQNYQQGRSGLGTYCKGLEDLLGVEFENVCAIFERERWTAVHKLTCDGAIEEFAKTLRNLHAHVLAHPMTDCYLALEVLDLVQGLSVRIGGKNPDLRPTIDDAVRAFKSFGKEIPNNLLFDLKNRVANIVAIPADCSAVPPTYDAMARLQTLTGYLIPLGSILATRKNNTLDVGMDSESAFSNHMTETISILLTALDAKAQTTLKSNKSAQSMFVANNIAVVERSLSIPQYSLIPMVNPRKAIEPFRKKGAKAYVDTWFDLVRNLQDQVHTGRSTGARPGSGGDSSAFLKSLSSKEREVIKERFKKFNEQLEELMARHKSYRIEPEVRADVGRDISDLVQPFYDRFWDRYHEIDKGKGKHAKFDKAGLATLLAGL